MVKNIETASLPEKTDLTVTLSRPYMFEGNEFTTLDLSNLENITTRALAEVSKVFATTEYLHPRPESDTTYCCMLAAQAIKQPYQFFDNLPAKDALKVRNVIQTFFQSED